jgi:predicted dehydrogenase
MTMTPGQAAVTPMAYTALCEYEPGADLFTTLHFNNIVRAKASHRYEWHLDGTLGSASATLTEVCFTSASSPGERQAVALAGRWYVDAFAAAMAVMLDAVVTGRPPATSGRDNCESLRVALAAIQAAETCQTVRLSTPDGEESAGCPS